MTVLNRLSNINIRVLPARKLNPLNNSSGIDLNAFSGCKRNAPAIVDAKKNTKNFRSSVPVIFPDIIGKKPASRNHKPKETTGNLMLRAFTILGMTFSWCLLLLFNKRFDSTDLLWIGIRRGKLPAIGF